MNDEQKRIFLAVSLSAIVLFGWQYFFAPKNPEYTLPHSPKAGTVVTDQQNIGTNNSSTLNSPAGGQEGIAAASQGTENELTYQSVRLVNAVGDEIEIDNRLNIVNIKGKDLGLPFQEMLSGKNPLQFFFSFDGINYQETATELKQIQGNIVEGKSLNGDLTFKGTLNENGKFHYEFFMQKPTKVKVAMHAKPHESANKHPNEFLLYAEDVERFKVGSHATGEKNSRWFGIDFNYHLLAVTFADKIPGLYQVYENGNFTVESSSPLSKLNGNLVFKKKNYNDLVLLGENLHLAVNFGILGLIAVPILKVLQFLYDFFPNYGIAIILLTILMKILTFPLQHKSYVGMKKMQKLQPEMQKIREQYKEDPQRMHKESMDLMKRSGANPLGGCLPMLLQLPIFIAFYKVLDSAVELVGAPFFGWIHDLSLKDPFYILPVVMTLVMFLQQKLTPTTTTDPAQQKMMLFMPFIFGFFMKDLPSGLSLYILVSTLCGIIQQMLVFRLVKA